jgi:hypothetical protein
MVFSMMQGIKLKFNPAMRNSTSQQMCHALRINLDQAGILKIEKRTAVVKYNWGNK